MWDIGKLNPQKLPNLKGSLSVQSGAPKPEENPTLNIDFKIQQLAISGGAARGVTGQSVLGQRGDWPISAGTQGRGLAYSVT